MNQGLEVDVLVVGAGPTGLTLACDLARRGVSCWVVEERDSETFTGVVEGQPDGGSRRATRTAH